jgi:hypothetical protein
MDARLVLGLSVGAMSLCTIVAIYYIWVRKLDKPDNTSR